MTSLATQTDFDAEAYLAWGDRQGVTLTATDAGPRGRLSRRCCTILSGLFPSPQALSRFVAQVLGKDVHWFRGLIAAAGRGCSRFVRPFRLV